MTPNILAPAPWSLRGSGLVLVYHFPHGFNTRYGFMEDYQHRGYRGWLGAVMVIDYTASNVGPYQELLFIPGLFRQQGHGGFSISKIWVSTQESLWNGQNNWGIPKELAQFAIKEQPHNRHSIEVRHKNHTFFEASYRSWPVPIPFTSKLIPGTRLLQQKEQQLLRTTIGASGTLRPASLQSVQADPDYFPPIQHFRPLATFRLQEFLMRFPVAQALR